MFKSKTYIEYLLNCLLLMISPVYLFSTNYIISLPDGKLSNLNCEVINEKKYISLKSLSEQVFPGSTLKEELCEILTFDFRLKVAPASFFILLENDNDIKVFQMTLPTIIYKDNVFVPFESFFKSLDNFKLFQVEFTDNKITLSTTRQKILKTKVLKHISKKFSGVKENLLEDSQRKDLKIAPIPLKDNDSDAFRDTQKSNINSINRYGNLKYNQTELKYNSFPKVRIPAKIDSSAPKNIKPDYYIIPDDLIRRDLDRMKGSKKNTDSLKSYNEEFEDYYYYINSTDDKINLDALYASIDINADTKVNIIDIFAVQKKNLTELHIVADGTIEVYHRPEINNDELILRIPDANNKISDFSDVIGAEPIVSIKAETIRNFLLYKIKYKNNFKECTSFRKGSREIIYQLHLKDANGNITEGSSSSFDTERKKWALDVIVLDPGHGGQDFGAISINGYKEKDIALKIAIKVKKLLNEHIPSTKVIMTREDDSFIELYKRGQIANQNSGKLFISIHLNSMPKIPHSANGIESYILRPGRNDEAIRVANRENAVIKLENDKSYYKELTNEEIIVATMAQSAFVRFSEMFARILQEEVSKSTLLDNKGVNQAGFYVLVGASMPNVLFEAGFLSNASDEKFITSEAGMNKIARGIFNAIKKYSLQYQQYVKSDLE